MISTPPKRLHVYSNSNQFHHCSRISYFGSNVDDLFLVFFPCNIISRPKTIWKNINWILPPLLA
uniref:Uncharacterized protein n=1 Tax=Anguilla anguilla TaxID=7936 RepID=A0A0E9S2H8_ANGAN